MEGVDAAEDGVKATPVAAASALAATVITTAAEGGNIQQDMVILHLTI